MTTVAIIGAGKVGSALAARCGAAGVAVRFGVRDPKGGTAAAAGGPALLSIADASASADVILLAVPAGAAIEALRSAGDLGGKIVVDATNPLRWDAGPVWAPPAEGSNAHAIAAALPAARVVKGFNHFGAEVQARPAYRSGPADALFAGDDAEAKQRVMDLAGKMGFRARDAGPLRNAAVLENLAVLWIHLAAVGGVGREFAFRVETR